MQRREAFVVELGACPHSSRLACIENGGHHLRATAIIRTPRFGSASGPFGASSYAKESLKQRRAASRRHYQRRVRVPFVVAAKQVDDVGPVSSRRAGVCDGVRWARRASAAMGWDRQSVFRIVAEVE